MLKLEKNAKNKGECYQPFNDPKKKKWRKILILSKIVVFCNCGPAVAFVQKIDILCVRKIWL
jgi:hypothetical protein